MEKLEEQFVVVEVAQGSTLSLAHFQRDQAVQEVYREEKGRWAQRPCTFGESWDEDELRLIERELVALTASGGRVLGVTSGGRTVAFAAVDARRLGPGGTFRQLLYCHVSRAYRGRGIGRRLIEEALAGLEDPVEGLYISAHSSVESTGFYLACGCLDAPWRYPEQVSKEPYDRQLVCYRKAYGQRRYCRLDVNDVEMLKGMDASQTIGRAWREVDGERRLVRIDYEDPTWPNGYEAHRDGFINAVEEGGVAIGALDETGRLIGFGTLRGKLYGNHHRYVLLDQLFISREQRGGGIGRRLFAYLAEHAKTLGGDHLYICAGSAEETIAFYRALGCRDADEVIPELAEEDPRDMQLVFTL